MVSALKLERGRDDLDSTTCLFKIFHARENVSVNEKGF